MYGQNTQTVTEEVKSTRDRLWIVDSGQDSLLFTDPGC
jgi:hypothetical protein